MLGSGLLLSSASMANTISSSNLYWVGESLSDADTQALEESTPWVYFSHTVDTATLERGENAVKLAVIDQEGSVRQLTLPLHLPVLPVNGIGGYSNIIRSGSISQSNDELSHKELQVISSGGNTDAGHVWAYYSGQNNARDNDAADKSTNIALTWTDSYLDTNELVHLQQLTIPEYPAEDLEGYANLIDTVELSRSTSATAKLLNVTASAGGVEGQGQTWAILEGSISLASNELGDIALSLTSTDKYSTAVEQGYFSNLFVNSERVSGNSSISYIQAEVNSSNLQLTNTHVNGPVYIATFSSPKSLNPINYTSMVSGDWLGETASYGRSYFAFTDGDSDFIDDRFDLDLDNDGLLNALEKAIGTDVRNPNTDGDALDDYQEYMAGLDPLDPNDLGLDPDEDGLTNEQEVALGTDIDHADTDRDGIPDKVEHDYGFDPTNTADAGLDFDKDGISNLDEYELGLNPTKPDSDGDGIADNIELELGLDGTDPSDALADADGDGVSNLEELALGTDPLEADSDGDGVSDGEELARGSDPLDPNSFTGSDYLLLTYSDVTGDDQEDWLAYNLDGVELTLKLLNSVDGVEVSSTSVSLEEKSPELVLLSDRNNDGLQELGLFYFNTTTQGYQLAVINPSNGKSLGRWNWPNTLNNVAFKEFSDLNGDGLNEYAISGVHKINGALQLFVKDGQSRSTFNLYKWPNLWKDIEFVTMDDVTGDNVPEVALYGRHNRLDKGQLFIHDGANATKADVYNWNKNWTNIQLFEMDDIDGEGTRDWGQFGQRKDDGRYQWIVKKGHNKKGVIRTFSWPADLTNVQPILAPDINGDGVREVAIAGLNSKKQLLLRINDGRANNKRLKNLSWPPLSNPTLTQLGDLDGDGVNDFGLYGFSSNGTLEIVVKSTLDRTTIGKASIPGQWEAISFHSQNVTGSDADDILLKAIDQNNSSLTVTIIDGETFAQSSYLVE
jgi:hypothetical protein